MSFLISAIKIIFLLGFLVFIHEGGHFIVAKLCKVKVNEFAIGFGPTIWRKNGKETKYALRLIPLGGFVSMEGEESPSDNIGSFSKASIPKRIAIVAAGGLVNILFGLMVYFIISSSSGVNISTTVDSVQNIDGEQISQIQSGDEILKINNKRVRNIQNVYKQLNKSSGNNIELQIKRNNEIVNFEITPIKDEQTGKYYIGIILKQAENNFANNIYYGFWDTVDFSVSIIDNLKLMFTGKVEADQLMGPIGISEVVSKTEGIKDYTYILALISLSLGVTNLLFFPPLDGGKIVLLIIEGIRKKPMKQELELTIQGIGFLFLIGLSIFVAFNDVARI